MTRPPTPSGGAALARSLRAMTVGTLSRYNDRQLAYNADALGEVDRQFQLRFTAGGGTHVTSFDTPTNGNAGGGPSRPINDGTSDVTNRPPPPGPVVTGLARGLPILQSGGGGGPSIDPTTLTELWTTQVLVFPAPFLTVSDERDLPFTVPVFTYGTSFTRGRRLVCVCSVVDWTIEETYVNGATIEFGVFRADSSVLGDFQVVLHLNFQGWATPHPPEPDAEAAA